MKSFSEKYKHFSVKEMFHLANQNDSEILMGLQNFGFYLGIGLTNILNTFNPEAVIIRNDIAMRNSISSRIYHQLDNSYETAALNTRSKRTSNGYILHFNRPLHGDIYCVKYSAGCNSRHSLKVRRGFTNPRPLAPPYVPFGIRRFK